MTLPEAILELEQAARELGDDTPLEGELLDLAVIAMALQCAEMWRETDGPLLHFDSPRVLALDELMLLHGAWWRVIGWEKRGSHYRITVEKC